jgi:hypothetical protein
MATLKVRQLKTGGLITGSGVQADIVGEMNSG